MVRIYDLESGVLEEVQEPVRVPVSASLNSPREPERLEPALQIVTPSLETGTAPALPESLVRTDVERFIERMK